MSDLQKAILRTLAYFALFDYPLTVLEIYKWLNIADGTRISADSSQMTRRWLADIQEALSQVSNKVDFKSGFYFLKSREEIVRTRLSRYNISEERFKRALKFIRILRFVPFIKCIMVCNRLGYSNVHQNSDIDLAVITKKNRLWLTRLLSVGFLSILKVRPKQIKRSKAIDLSFFISEDSLNLESLKFSQDVHFPYWVNQFIPVFDDGIFQKFIQDNQWVRKYLPNSFDYQLNQRRVVESGLLVRLVNQLISLLVDWNFMEKWAKKYQLKILPEDLKEMMNQDSRVVVNDKILKFHRQDSRREVQCKFDRLLYHCHFD